MSLVGFVECVAGAFGILSVPLPYRAPFETLPPPSAPEPVPPSWRSHEVWSDAAGGVALLTVLE